MTGYKVARAQVWGARALLALIVLLGLTLRGWNLDFDRGIGSHPDERSTACFYAPTIAWPQSWAEFRDPQRSPLNPLWDRNQGVRRSFTYGHFPLYLGVGMGHALATLAPVAEWAGAPDATVALMSRANRSCDAIAVAGRLTIALLDTLTIVLVYLLARRWSGIGSRGIALLAAGLYAFTAQAIQLSHFFAMDPASTTFTVLAVLGGVIMAQDRSLRAAVVCGIGVGLAIASKFSALPILAVPVVAAGIWFFARSRGVGLAIPNTGSDAQGEADGATDARTRLAALVALGVALAFAGASFVLTSPYAVLDWRNFIQATLVEQGQMVRGVADFPFTRQYRNTTPYIYFIAQQVQWGLGWPLGLTALAGTLLAFAGLCWSLWRTLFRPRLGGQWSDGATTNLLVWTWIAPYFGLTGAFLAKFNRYMSPILPFVVIFAAILIGVLWRAGHDALLGRGWRWGARGLAVLIGTIALVGAAGWSAAYVNGVYNREHTWITASRWIYEHAPRGSVILWELWDDPLPKSIPGEPGMDMGTTGLRNIDWSPYEEDTAEKYAILKQKLREADFVVYSSKRIYDSVDELPERYPMTILYYEAMWDGRLGFELAAEFTSPPQILGWRFEDRHADESWSLYDHPQVTVFRKVRDLSDAEFDALFDRAWESAIPYYRGKDSPLSPILELMGLGSSPGSDSRGLVSRVVQWVSGESTPAPPTESRQTIPPLLFDRPLAELPLVDNYRWNHQASAMPWLAVGLWWLVIAFLGWSVWPLCFVLFPAFPDRGLLLSRSLGWLLAAWLLWFAASNGLLTNTVRAAWWTALSTAVIGAATWRVVHREMATFIRRNWRVLIAGEAVWSSAFIAFILVRMVNPDLWQPWFGGEKFMEFAFLNGILRSPSFPPVDPHFAGGFINYYYFGIYLVAYAIKLTGIYAEVAYNLAIPTLFAMTVGNAFAVAHAAWSQWAPNQFGRHGLRVALLAPFMVAMMGNLDGFAQVVRQLGERASIVVVSAIPGIATAYGAMVGLIDLLRGRASLPGYDFWGPSRVIPATINEFPYWSFLFADLHPHMIGIPFSLLFLAVLLAMMSGRENPQDRIVGSARRLRWAWWLLLAFLLGTLASVNLWELPTYFGLGVLGAAAAEYRAQGRVRLVRLFTLALVYLALAFLFYQPFFSRYVNVGASGPGWVRAGDDLGAWLLVWGTLAFVVSGGLVVLAAGSGSGQNRVVGQAGAQTGLAQVGVGGVARKLGLAMRYFERLPRVYFLHRLLVRQPTVAYLLGDAVLPLMLVCAVVAWWLDRAVLALCLALLGLALPLLWQRRRDLDAGGLFAVVLAVGGLAILAGTQVIYLKDFLQGGDWYRMNTLFKFFIQVWVLWGMAAAILLPRVWAVGRRENRVQAGDQSPATAETRIADDMEEELPAAPPVWEPHPRRIGRRVAATWRVVAVTLLTVSCTFLVLGTPARLSQRMVGWRPPIGTLDGLAFMDGGSYSWPNDGHRIELRYDVAAIRWLLDHVAGNVVIVESAEVDYYRAGGTRVASMTGLSGLRGMHAGEQRAGWQVGERDGLHRELWSTPSEARTQALFDLLHVALVYVGQLEEYVHPEGAAKFAAMAAAGSLDVLYRNERVVIYAVPGRLTAIEGGRFVPSSGTQGMGRAVPHMVEPRLGRGGFAPTTNW